MPIFRRSLAQSSRLVPLLPLLLRLLGRQDVAIYLYPTLEQKRHSGENINCAEATVAVFVVVVLEGKRCLATFVSGNHLNWLIATGGGGISE